MRFDENHSKDAISGMACICSYLVFIVMMIIQSKVRLYTLMADSLMDSQERCSKSKFSYPKAQF